MRKRSGITHWAGAPSALKAPNVPFLDLTGTQPAEAFYGTSHLNGNHIPTPRRIGAWLASLDGAAPRADPPGAR